MEDVISRLPSAIFEPVKVLQQEREIGEEEDELCASRGREW